MSMRAFSRANIIKELDKSKISRKTFVKKELTENPEFFKAYPHMQSIYGVEEEREENRDEEPYQNDMQVSFKDPN